MLARIRFFIWCLAALTIATAFLLAVVNTAQTNTRLMAQQETKDRTAAADRREASAERARLLQGQRRLEVKYDALLTTQSRIVSYLNGRGIFIPTAVFDGDSNGDGHADSDSNGSPQRSSSAGGSGKQSPSKSGSAPHGNGTSAGRPGQGHRAGGGHGKGHRPPSKKGHSGAKAKGHGKAKGHK